MQRPSLVRACVFEESRPVAGYIGPALKAALNFRCGGRPLSERKRQERSRFRDGRIGIGTREKRVGVSQTRNVGGRQRGRDLREERDSAENTKHHDPNTRETPSSKPQASRQGMKSPVRYSFASIPLPKLSTLNGRWQR